MKLLQELLTKGYTIHYCSNLKQRYQTLRKYFPKVCKVKMYGRNIFFIEDKNDVIDGAFLENINKKIISYQELKQVTKVFNTNLSKRERQTFLGRFKSKKSLKISHSKDNSFLKNDNSLAIFYIRNYCRDIFTELSGLFL